MSSTALYVLLLVTCPVVLLLLLVLLAVAAEVRLPLLGLVASQIITFKSKEPRLLSAFLSRCDTALLVSLCFVRCCSMCQDCRVAMTTPYCM